MERILSPISIDGSCTDQVRHIQILLKAALSQLLIQNQVRSYHTEETESVEDWLFMSQVLDLDTTASRHSVCV